MQACAVHLVDLDAPWRPTDVSHCHGRIIRQGNQNPEVGISQVVTKGSFDTFMWQALERKSKFIDQIMRGRLDVREIEDVGDNTLSFAEVKTISSGNPLILEKSKADQELTRLQRLERGWHRNQAALTRRKDSSLVRGRALVAELPALKEAAARTIPDVGGDTFRMTINGWTVDKRTDAVEALRTWADRNAAGRPPIQGSKDLGVMASIGGHDIRFIQREANMVEMGASRIELQIEGAPGVAVELKRSDALFPTVGVIQRLENQVTRLPDEVVKRERQLEEARQEYRDAANALKQPFKDTEALDKAKWEVERISREMRGEDAAQTTLTPKLEELKRHMRMSYPNPPKPGQTPSKTAEQHRNGNVPGPTRQLDEGLQL